MLTEAGAERKAFKEQGSMRQHVRDYAKANARRDVIRKLDLEFLNRAAQERFERLLQGCEKDAGEIACEAGEEAAAETSRTELGVAAYEVAYIKAYSEALPMLIVTEWARRNPPDPVAAET
jgi:hypothetical protein